MTHPIHYTKSRISWQTGLCSIAVEAVEIVGVVKDGGCGKGLGFVMMDMRLVSLREMLTILVSSIVKKLLPIEALPPPHGDLPPPLKTFAPPLTFF